MFKRDFSAPTLEDHFNKTILPKVMQVRPMFSVSIQSIQQTLLSKATYNKYICQKKEKRQDIAVNTVKMFRETSTNNH